MNDKQLLFGHLNYSNLCMCGTNRKLEIGKLLFSSVIQIGVDVEVTV